MYTLILFALIGGAFSETIQGKKAVYDKVDYNGDVYSENVCVGVGKCLKPLVRTPKLVPVPHACVALCRHEYKDTCASSYFDPSNRNCYLLKERCTKAELTDLNSNILYFHRRKFTESGCPDLGDAPGYDCKKLPADIVFVLDSSGSISNPDYAKMMTFVKNFVREQEVGPTAKQIGVITFGTVPILRFHLGRYSNKQDVLDAISAIVQTNGGTNTAAALELARKEAFLLANGGRKDTLKIVIVITDGGSGDPTKTVQEADKLRGDGVMVLAIGVGVGNNINAQNELKGIAGPTRVENVDSFSDLNNIQEKLIEATCDISPPRIYKDTYCSMMGKRCPGRDMYLGNPWKCRTRQFCADKCSRIVECGMFDWRPKSDQDVTSHLAIGTCYHKIKPCSDSELVDAPNYRNYRRLLKTESECPANRRND